MILSLVILKFGFTGYFSLTMQDCVPFDIAHLFKWQSTNTVASRREDQTSCECPLKTCSSSSCNSHFLHFPRLLAPVTSRARGGKGVLRSKHVSLGYILVPYG